MSTSFRWKIAWEPEPHLAILSNVLEAPGLSSASTRNRSALCRGIHKVAKLVRSYPFDINVFIEHVHPYALSWRRFTA
jgi:hypothetical protein